MPVGVPRRRRFAIEKQNTRLTLSQLGWGSSGEWPKVRAYFERAWPNVLKQLQQRFETGHTVSIAYDPLGRMTQRTEADLVSDWSYDKKFDGTACGKGVGKLCEAKAANGYVRQHTYDNLGRPSVMSTVLDNLAAPAVVTETYDLNTGRVASKTWPSGYQASYLFSPLGYLKKVTGGGTNGFAQTVSYEVLAMNPKAR